MVSKAVYLVFVTTDQCKELREKIYKLAFDTDLIGAKNLSLLPVCRQIYHEAGGIGFDLTWWNFTRTPKGIPALVPFDHEALRANPSNERVLRNGLRVKKMVFKGDDYKRTITLGLPIIRPTQLRFDCLTVDLEAIETHRMFSRMTSIAFFYQLTDIQIHCPEESEFDFFKNSHEELIKKNGGDFTNHYGPLVTDVENGLQYFEYSSFNKKNGGRFWHWISADNDSEYTLGDGGPNMAKVG